MRRTLFAIAFTAFSAVGYLEMGGTMQAASIPTVSSAGSEGGSMSAPAPAAKRTNGTVKSVAASSLTITAAGKDMTFTVDDATKVTGKGAGTKAKQAGGRTPITDLVSTGDAVSVTYHDMGGSMHAAAVRVTRQMKK
jgi:hypothetical protein